MPYCEWCDAAHDPTLDDCEGRWARRARRAAALRDAARHYSGAYANEANGHVHAGVVGRRWAREAVAPFPELDRVRSDLPSYPADV